MNTQKPTEAFLTIARAIAPKTEGNVLILPGGQREFGEKCAADVLTALDGAGYVIVPREAPDGWARVNVKMWDNLLQMISAAEKGE